VVIFAIPKSLTRLPKGFDMKAKVFSRDTIRLFLATVMAFCLFLGVAFGTAALVWYGQPYGANARLVAGIFAWVFTAAFLSAFALAVFEERERGQERSGRLVAGAKE
jgi:hypothetical protein